PTKFARRGQMWTTNTQSGERGNNTGVTPVAGVRLKQNINTQCLSSTKKNYQEPGTRIEFQTLALQQHYLPLVRISHYNSTTKTDRKSSAATAARLATE